MATSDELAAELAREIRAAVAETGPSEDHRSRRSGSRRSFPTSVFRSSAPSAISRRRSPTRAGSSVPSRPRFASCGFSGGTRRRSTRSMLEADQRRSPRGRLGRGNPPAGERAAGRGASADIIRAQDAAREEARRRDSAQDTRIAYLETLSSRIVARRRAAPRAGDRPAPPPGERLRALRGAIPRPGGARSPRSSASTCRFCGTCRAPSSTRAAAVASSSAS